MLDPHNANRGTTRGLEALEQSLRDFGAGRSIVLDRHGKVVAGNKTAARARQLGLKLRVVRTTRDYLVAVQRDDLDLDDPRSPARALASADNRVGELDLEWDVEMLQQLHAEGLDLAPWFTDAELTELLNSHQTSGKDDENAVIAPADTNIEIGDLFVLGTHRLLCGDATSEADVARLLEDRRPLLMTSDPPYGVNYDPGWRHQRYPSQRTAVGRVLNDHRSDWTDAFKLFTGAVAYVWHSAMRGAIVGANLERAGFSLRSQIIWRKQHFALSRGDYHWAHEPAWYAVRRGRRGEWRGDRSQTTVWDVPNLNPMGGDREAENAASAHGTQKPVRLFEIPILNHTLVTDVVYDPFVGSGTAIIAAEKTGRSCLAMDLDPRYVQVAITRWERFTGRRAERVSQGSGRRRTR